MLSLSRRARLLHKVAAAPGATIGMPTSATQPLHMPTADYNAYLDRSLAGPTRAYEAAKAMPRTPVASPAVAAPSYSAPAPSVASRPTAGANLRDAASATNAGLSMLPPSAAAGALYGSMDAASSLAARRPTGPVAPVSSPPTAAPAQPTVQQPAASVRGYTGATAEALRQRAAASANGAPLTEVDAVGARNGLRPAPTPAPQATAAVPSPVAHPAAQRTATAQPATQPQKPNYALDVKQGEGWQSAVQRLNAQNKGAEGWHDLNAADVQKRTGGAMLRAKDHLDFAGFGQTPATPPAAGATPTPPPAPFNPFQGSDAKDLAARQHEAQTLRQRQVASRQPTPTAPVATAAPVTPATAVQPTPVQPTAQHTASNPGGYASPLLSPVVHNNVQMPWNQLNPDTRQRLQGLQQGVKMAPEAARATFPGLDAMPATPAPRSAVLQSATVLPQQVRDRQLVGR